MTVSRDWPAAAKAEDVQWWVAGTEGGQLATEAGGEGWHIRIQATGEAYEYNSRNTTIAEVMSGGGVLIIDSRPEGTPQRHRPPVRNTRPLTVLLLAQSIEYFFI